MKHILIAVLASAVFIFAAACSTEESSEISNETDIISQSTLSVASPETTASSTPRTSIPSTSITEAAMTTTELAFPLTIAAEINNPPYERSDYGAFRVKVDRNLGWNKSDCKWGFYASTPRNCPTEDAGKVNNRDHMVPVADAHRSGGYAWSSERKKDFYSDTDNLFVISASENKSKSDKDPSEWQPANSDAHCEYARKWIEIKTEWGLSADRDEATALERMLATC